mgnify:CR=1 FL=1
MAAVGIVLGVAGVAKADAGAAVPFQLAWDAPAGCPDGSFVRQRVEQIVRAPPLERTVVTADAKIDSVAGGYRLLLTLRTGDVEETKTITAATCSSLAQATATIVALAIEAPTSGAGERAPPGASDVGLGPRPAAEPVAREPGRDGTVDTPAASPEPTRPAPASRAPRRSWSFAPGAFPSIDTATLPAASAGFGVSAALRLSRFRVGASGTFTLPQSSRYTRTARVTFDKIDVGAWGAYLVPLGSELFLGPTAELGATFVHVEGLGLRSPRKSWTAWPTIATGGRLEAHVTRWLSLVARTELVFHVDAPRFSLATVEEPLRLHDPGSPAVRIALGAEIVLP